MLVCFAVKEEAAPFQTRAESIPNVRVLVTGMGRRRADRAVRQALADFQPALVLTCGFAGGLRPDLLAGTVLFDSGGSPDLDGRLKQAGAVPGRFHCASRVAATAKEKETLRALSGADAVEMESEIIVSICRERKIPCVTVRVVLDPAGEDLPLDFNAFMDADQQMKYGKLALAVVKSPGKLRALLQLAKASRAAAEKLAEVIGRVVVSD